MALKYGQQKNRIIYMRILITGATGFVGKNLVLRLLNLNEKNNYYRRPN